MPFHGTHQNILQMVYFNKVFHSCCTSSFAIVSYIETALTSKSTATLSLKPVDLSTIYSLISLRKPYQAKVTCLSPHFTTDNVLYQMVLMVILYLNLTHLHCKTATYISGTHSF